MFLLFHKNISNVIYQVITAKVKGSGLSYRNFLSPYIKPPSLTTTTTTVSFIKASILNICSNCTPTVYVSYQKHLYRILYASKAHKHLAINDKFETTCYHYFEEYI